MDEDKAFYRKLFKVVSDPEISALLYKYAEMHYNSAIMGLKTSTDILTIGKMQGKAAMAELFMNIRSNTEKAITV